jgi:hypothetical protein
MPARCSRHRTFASHLSQSAPFGFPQAATNAVFGQEFPLRLSAAAEFTLP